MPAGPGAGARARARERERSAQVLVKYPPKFKLKRKSFVRHARRIFRRGDVEKRPKNNVEMF